MILAFLSGIYIIIVSICGKVHKQPNISPYSNSFFLLRMATGKFYNGPMIIEFVLEFYYGPMIIEFAFYYETCIMKREEKGYEEKDDVVGCSCTDSVHAGRMRQWGDFWQ